MTNILGISAFYHDSAACLVRDGEIVAAAQEERFTRKKHDPRFPSRAISYCLREGKISLTDLRYIVFYEKPLVKFERLLETYSVVCTTGYPLIRGSHAGVAERETDAEKSTAEGPAGARPRRVEIGLAADPILRAPRIPCCLGLLSLTIRNGRDPLHGRGRRMGDHFGLAGPRTTAHSPVGDLFSALARPPLLGLYLLHRVQGELRRI